MERIENQTENTRGLPTNHSQAYPTLPPTSTHHISYTQPTAHTSTARLTMSSSPLENLETQLEMFIENVRQVRIIVSDFQPQGQNVLNQKM